MRPPPSCMRWSTTSRTSRRSCSNARRCCSIPIWSIRRGRRPRCRARSRAAWRCRARSRRRSPRSARAEACLTLIENPGADIAPFSLDRIVERFGHLAAIREALLAWPDLPARRARRWSSSCPRRSRASSSHAQLAGRGQGAAHRAGSLREGDRHRSRRDVAPCEVSPLVASARDRPAHAGLVLRSLLSGNIDFFEQALAELADCRLARVERWCTTARRRASRRSTSARAAGLGVSGVPRGDRGMHETGCRPSRAAHAAQAPHGRARADKLRPNAGRRHRAADDAAAPLRDRGRARRGAAVLRRAGRDGRHVCPPTIPARRWSPRRDLPKAGAASAKVRCNEGQPPGASGGDRIDSR
jgi:hypothetical protein